MNGCGIEIAVALRARSLDGRTLRPVENLELNTGAIGRLPHQAPERVNLFDEVSFGEAADRGIARHPPDRLPQHGHHTDAHPAPRTNASGLGAGVPAADDDDIEVSQGIHVPRGTVE